MATVYERIQTLGSIITDAITAGDSNDIPAKDDPNNLIKVATGRYREVCPIIVPERTCVLGDELRSTEIGPAAPSTDLTDAKYSLETLGRLENIVGDIITGSSVSATTGNVESQDIAFPFADSPEEDTTKLLVRTMQQRIDFLTGGKKLAFKTDPTGYNTSFLNGYGDARKLVEENKKFFQEQVIAFIGANYEDVKYSRTKCKQDVGYIIDAILYDLTYGGTYQSLTAGLAYYEGTTLQFDSSETAATLAAYAYLKSIVQAVALNNTVPALQDDVPQFRGTGGSSAASTAIGGMFDIITTIIQGGLDARPNTTISSISAGTTLVTSSAHGLSTGDSITPRTSANGLVADQRYWVLTTPTSTQLTVSETLGGSTKSDFSDGSVNVIANTVDYPTATDGVTSTTALITAAETLDAQQETLVSALTSFISSNFPSLSYDSTKCERDTRLILEAVMFDFQFNTNVATTVAAYSYLRASANDVYDLGQKAATRAAYANLAETIAGDTATYLNGNATAATRTADLLELLDTVIYSGSFEGTNTATSTRNRDYAVLQLERNRDFIVAELNAYIADTYADTVTATTASSSALTISDTSWLQRNTAIEFAGTAIGDLTAGTTYYVQDVIDGTTFTIATTRNATSALAVTDDTGSMSVTLKYDSDACSRDTNAYIDALKYDIKYPGNYKSLYAARYYANAVTGSLEEDVYYLRNATGVRNQTISFGAGDLLAENEYGTSRVSGGVYCGLDPGWGPADDRAWITERSPYVQGVTTFGTACIGQKIDGDLHDGGNDSIVSNDFTQVISDGIGAWITNNGRAELVSVFSYYAHIAYLAENGGRIRATNGNNSYGDYGSVAEGFDSRETPGSAVVDNILQFDATINSISVGGGELKSFQFANAGQDYTEVDYSFTGGGIDADIEGDEFRDDAVHEVRLLDLGDDSSGQFGGEGYLTANNTAQTGTTSSITLAATDGELSTAYPGMKVVLTGGTGAGQYALINTYDAATKLATVVSEYSGSAGWDSFTPGVDIVAPDSSTTYTIEPALSFTSPTFTANATTMPSSPIWKGLVYGDTTDTFSAISADTYSGSGTGATFDVVRNGYKYIVNTNNAGTGYARSQTLTFNGSNLGGTDTTNDLVLTITAVNSVTGAILDFDQTGSGKGGVYVATPGSGTGAASSADGDSWTARTLPSAGDWRSVTHSLIDDGSSDLKIGRFVAVRYGSSAAAYSDDGETWNATTLPASANWTSVTANRNGRFVAVADDTATVAISNDGVVWDLTGDLSDTGFKDVAYGKGKFVAIKTGDTNGARYSTNGGVSWTAVNLPENSTWESITYGNNTFVVVGSDTNTVALSDDGITWIDATIASVDGSSTGGFFNVSYGQGLFMATSTQNGVTGYQFVMKSENGVYWESESIPTNGGPQVDGYNAIAHGNPQRTGRWVTIMNDSGDHAVYIDTGATTRARVESIATGAIQAISLTEPGSGYNTAPTMTITDPNNIFDLPVSIRLASGTLANPSFINRGSDFDTAGATVIPESSDGVADFFQPGSFVAVRRISERPVAGSNIEFASLPGQVFKLVNVLTFLGDNDGSYTAFYQVSPQLGISEAPPHLDQITTRLRYSQCRLTGHDFLDIGTGNFAETNYPGEPTQDPIPARETVESNGGRVFFTSTDQDGNFRVGELFSIEQATGVATLNADAFNISGLQELNLGNVTLGGGSATVTEFSTDPFFTADSDNVVPTQRAIRAYIASQIGGGGASLVVNSVTAGNVFIATNAISHINPGSNLVMAATFDFRRPVTGVPLAFNYFLT